MKKRSILVLISALLFAGCYSENHHRATGLNFDGDAHKVEVEIPGDGSAVDRFEMGVSVVKSLEDLDLNSLLASKGAEPAGQLGGSGEVGFSVSMESSSSLLVFKSERVVVTCSVSGFQDNERAGSVCRDVLLSEIEKKS